MTRQEQTTILLNSSLKIQRRISRANRVIFAKKLFYFTAALYLSLLSITRILDLIFKYN